MLGLHCCTGFCSSWSKQGLLSSCGAQASHCGVFSCCGAQTLGCAVFSSCGSWVLEHWLSSTCVHGLSCSVARGIFPDQGSNLCLLHWQVDSTATRKAPPFFGYSSVQSLSCVWLIATPWTAAHQASLSITNSQGPLKVMSIESVMPSNHLILCRPLVLPPSIFPIIRVLFSNELVLHIRWPKYWSFSFSISPSNEYYTVGHSGICFPTRDETRIPCHGSTESWSPDCQGSLRAHYIYY